MIRAAELDADLVQRWASLQEADTLFRSPFFRPEFTLAVAQARDDAYVGVLTEGGTPAGFFPFQRSRGEVGEPVGGQRSNYQGVIAAPDLEWDAAELIRACGLKIWDFHQVPTGQAQFERFHAHVEESPGMDLSGGFETYAQCRGEDGSRVLKRLRQQERRAERDLGSLRFVPHESDVAALRLMMRWKSHQYQTTNSEDRFAIPWNVKLLDGIHGWQTDGFAGMLPTLYCDDKVIAVAMCLRSRGTVHYWFPAYDRELASYSPGMLLLLRLAECAQEIGVDYVDLGWGRTPYKDRIATGGVMVAEGAVTVPSLAATLRSVRTGLERAVRNSPLHRPARSVLHAIRRV